MVNLHPSHLAETHIWQCNSPVCRLCPDNPGKECEMNVPYKNVMTKLKQIMVSGLIYVTKRGLFYDNSRCTFTYLITSVCQLSLSKQREVLGRSTVMREKGLNFTEEENRF